MKRRTAVFVLSVAVIAVSQKNEIFAAQTLGTVKVSGKCNPWLAGMPDGTISRSGYDNAPAESPAQAPVQIVPGAILTFAVTGGANHWPDCIPGAPNYSCIGPEGDTSMVVRTAAENGIADVSAPLVGLLGLFLDDNLPSQFAPPVPLSFGDAASRDFLTMLPELRQPFFIGDGATSSGLTQQVVVPVGATRLFFGTMDSVDWSDNSGSFDVTISYSAPTFPYVWHQPKSQIGFWGKNIIFNVTAFGESPLSFQWHKDGIPIPGAINSFLVLTNLQMGDAGAFSVVITNVYGSVTSNPALLTINPAGVSIASYAGITIEGVPGLTYGIQTNTDVARTNNWQGAANVVLTTPVQLWLDLEPATNPRKYYRVVPGPVPIP